MSNVSADRYLCSNKYPMANAALCEGALAICIQQVATKLMAWPGMWSRWWQSFVLLARSANSHLYRMHGQPQTVSLEYEHAQILRLDKEPSEGNYVKVKVGIRSGCCGHAVLFHMVAAAAANHVGWSFRIYDRI